MDGRLMNLMGVRLSAVFDDDDEPKTWVRCAHVGEEFSFALLPCGCRWRHLRDHGWLIECASCGATITQRVFDAWYKAIEWPPQFRYTREPARLLRIGERVVEVVGNCGCGLTLVREKPTDVPQHLMFSAPPVLLRN